MTDTKHMTEAEFVQHMRKKRGLVPPPYVPEVLPPEEVLPLVTVRPAKRSARCVVNLARAQWATPKARVRAKHVCQAAVGLEFVATQEGIEAAEKAARRVLWKAYREKRLVRGKSGWFWA